MKNLVLFDGNLIDLNKVSYVGKNDTRVTHAFPISFVTHYFPIIIDGNLIHIEQDTKEKLVELKQKLTSLLIP